MTTPTPSGLTASRMASAIWRVSRSWTCNRRENMSAIRASLLNPITCRGAKGGGLVVSGLVVDVNVLLPGRLVAEG